MDRNTKSMIMVGMGLSKVSAPNDDAMVFETPIGFPGGFYASISVLMGKENIPDMVNTCTTKNPSIYHESVDRAIASVSADIYVWELENSEAIKKTWLTSGWVIDIDKGGYTKEGERHLAAIGKNKKLKIQGKHGIDSELSVDFSGYVSTHAILNSCEKALGAMDGMVFQKRITKR